MREAVFAQLLLLCRVNFVVAPNWFGRGLRACGRNVRCPRVDPFRRFGAMLPVSGRTLQASSCRGSRELSRVSGADRW